MGYKMDKSQKKISYSKMVIEKVKREVLCIKKLEKCML